MNIDLNEQELITGFKTELTLVVGKVIKNKLDSYSFKTEIEQKVNSGLAKELDAIIAEIVADIPEIKKQVNLELRNKIRSKLEKQLKALEVV